MSLTALSRTQVRGEFYRALNDTSFSQYWPRIAVFNPASTGASEVYGFTGSAPAASPWLGSRNTKNLEGRQITVTNTKYESSIDMSAEAWRRDQTGELQRKVGDLAMRMQELPIRILSTLIKNGGGSTNGLAHDGQYFFDSDHVWGDSGTQTNLLTSSDYGVLNVATATTPTAEEFVDCLLAVASHILSFKDDEGQPMHPNAKEFLFMCAPSVWPAAMAAVKANSLAGGETNVAAAMSMDGWKFTPVLNTRLYTSAADAAFYMFVTDSPSMKPFIFQEEQAPTLQILDESSDYFFDTDSFKFGSKWTGGGGYGEPLTGAKATMS